MKFHGNVGISPLNKPVRKSKNVPHNILVLKRSEELLEKGMHYTDTIIDFFLTHFQVFNRFIFLF